MKINVDCPGNRSGYGKVAEGLRKAFTDLGYELAEDAGLRLCVYPTFGLRDFPKGTELWCLTMWETDRIPEIVVEQIDNFAGIIVPNGYNLEQFSEWHPNVHLARLGVDPKLWAQHDRKAVGTLRFLVCGPRAGGGSDVRKGIGDVQEAFRQAFPNPKALKPLPELTVLHTRGRYTDAELVRIFHEHHVYVSLSHGEGWHMYPFQMLATGAPVVVSKVPGHMEWASWLPGCVPVPCDMEPSPIGGVASSWSGNWWKPDIARAVEALRFVHANFLVLNGQAQAGAAKIRQTLTWKHCAEAIIDIVGDHERPDVDLSDLRAPTKRTFPALALRSEVVDIGEARITLTKDRALELDSDQLRVLTQSGLVSALS